MSQTTLDMRIEFCFSRNLAEKGELPKRVSRNARTKHMLKKTEISHPQKLTSNVLCFTGVPNSLADSRFKNNRKQESGRVRSMGNKNTQPQPENPSEEQQINGTNETAEIEPEGNNQVDLAVSEMGGNFGFTA